MGHTNPGLRTHLRPILDVLGERTKSSISQHRFNPMTMDGGPPRRYRPFDEKDNIDRIDNFRKNVLPRGETFTAALPDGSTITLHHNYVEVDDPRDRGVQTYESYDDVYQRELEYSKHHDPYSDVIPEGWFDLLDEKTNYILREIKMSDYS